MAIALENSNLVWQKVKIALANAGPAVQTQFAALKAYLAQQKRNPDLQFIPFTEAQADDADGTGLLDAPGRLVAVYFKKDATATDNWLKFYNDTTSDADDAEAMIALPLLEASKEGALVYPDGLPFSAGVTVTQHTTQVGSTDGSDGASGFIIVAAA